MQSRDFSKFLYDVEEIIKLLLEENESFKSQYIKSQTEVNAFEVENKNLNDILTRTIEYAKGLERELLEIANDPNIIGNSEGLELELESHKKALKGLTSKYNQLERKMDLITNKNSLDTSYVRIDTESEDFSRSSYDV